MSETIRDIVMRVLDGAQWLLLLYLVPGLQLIPAYERCRTYKAI